MKRTLLRAFRLGLFSVLTLLSVPSLCRGQARPDTKPEDSLVHQDLYLRGFWQGAKLEFDAAGKPLKEYTPGPITLSGIDVLSLHRDRHRLFLHAAKVALVADAGGRLQRHPVTNTTRMFGTLQKKFVARQELDIIVNADSNGSFTTALEAIFVHGLADLALSVPSYWKCYAAAYFSADVSDEEARERVRRCVQEPGISDESSPDRVTSPSILSSQQPSFNQAAFEVNASGESKVHVIVSKAGSPVRLQVVQAVGAGLDEAALDAISHWQFHPATKDLLPVLSQTDITIDFRTR